MDRKSRPITDVPISYGRPRLAGRCGIFFTALFRDVAPTDGVALNREQVEWGSAIRAIMRQHRGDDSNDPFYWPEHKPDIRYSRAEWQRVQNETGGFSYHGCSIDERRGDRVLMVGHFPSAVPAM